MRMLKWALLAACLSFSAWGQTPFVPGQVLTAEQLNAAFAAISTPRYAEDDFTGSPNLGGLVFTLSHAPVGNINIALDGLRITSSNYAISGTTLTLSGLTAANYQLLQASYSY